MLFQTKVEIVQKMDSMHIIDIPDEFMNLVIETSDVVAVHFGVSLLPRLLVVFLIWRKN